MTEASMNRGYGQNDLIQYHADFTRYLSQMERTLYCLRKPEDIIQGMLKGVCEFYQADWSGILEADIECGVWNPAWWYNAQTGGMTETKIHSIEVTEGFERWADALEKGVPVTVSDVEELKETSSVEYYYLKRLQAICVLGAPYQKRSAGFLVVRNPQRYAEHIEFLQVLTYVVASEVDERRLIDGSNMVVPPQMIKNENDVYISLFGGFEITTYRGKLTDEKLKSPKFSRIIVFLLMHRNRSVSSREIAEKLWPDEIEAMMINIRSLVYRIRKMFRLIADIDLIITDDGKYRLNPELSIMTDMEMFDRLRADASVTANERARIQYLRKASRLYKGLVFPEACNEHWLMSLCSDYQLRYLEIEEQLLNALALKNSYKAVYEEAKRAIEHEKGNGNLHFWMIYSLIKQGSTEMVKHVLEMAKENLTEEDYNDLIERIKQI